MMVLTEALLYEHYRHLCKYEFFNEIKESMRRTPVIACCCENVDCADTVRKLCDITNGRETDPGMIRGDLAMSIQSNLLLASESPKTAEVELERFFNPEELFEYEDILHQFIYSQHEV